MSWPWERRGDERIRKIRSDAMDEKRLKGADDDLTLAKQLRAESERMAHEARRHRAENHWADSVRRALLGG